MEEKELIQKLNNSQTKERAFAHLVEIYQERLYWHIRKTVLHHEDADDVLQNTFVKVWKNIEKFRGEAKLYTWLYRIASNEVYTFLTKEKKHRSTSLDSDELNPVLSSLRSDPYFDGDEYQQIIQAAIQSLPEKQKQVFIMRYEDELTYDEISEILGTSTGALKASYHHAVKKIEDFVRSRLNE